MKNTVLILDDEIAFSELLVELIRGYGHDAIRLDSKLSGYYWAIANNPDLIITDIHAPEINGFEFLKLIRNCKSTRDIPVVFISAGGDDNRNMALSLGASEVHQKPFYVDQFTEMLGRISN
jgi:two-component system phosphate regulon response regulator PhoB